MAKSEGRIWLLFENSPTLQEVDSEVSSTLSFKGQRCEFASLMLRFFGRLGIKGERLGLMEIINRLRWVLVSKGRGTIFYVLHRGEVIHSSFLIPACLKFPFMKSDDWEIGPCFTAPAWRGLGIYPTVLKRIISRGGGRYYMIVSPANASSIRGVEKAGFKVCGKVVRTTFLRYKLM